MGVVTDDVEGEPLYPIEVKFGEEDEFFTRDGKLYDKHTLPCLYTLEEAREMGFEVPREKVKKWRWAYFYNGLWSITPHLTEEEASGGLGGTSHCQKLEGSMIEVEV